jgi:hypothetical protein
VDRTLTSLSPVKAAAILALLAGVSASLTGVFLGMRAVMDIGGVCASGGPYVPVQPCPSGVPLVLIGGIWLGIICAFAYAFMVAGTPMPSLTGLFWPALFLSLGWNFLEYGVSPPGGAEGVVWGWLVCGVSFALMGGVPLWWVVRSASEQHPATPLLRPPGGRLVIEAARRVAGTAAGATLGRGMVDELERLDTLHRSGAIDATEYRAAKRRLIVGGDA